MTWDEAFEHAADRFAAVIREHGRDSVAFDVSGQFLTEDYYVFNKLAKGLVGTNNIDSNSQLCMSSAAAGYQATLGADAPPACHQLRLLRSGTTPPLRTSQLVVGGSVGKSLPSDSRANDPL